MVEVLNSESAIADKPDARTDVANGAIDFERVSFRYPGTKKDQLHDVDLHIKSGQTIGIIGETGTSKSTLVELIPRLYDATAGTVRVAGQDVRDYDLKTLRDNVSVVLQTTTLFSGTIRDNLKWGDADATDEEIQHAAQLAQADGFIQTLPQGYDTPLEQTGQNVSGGQKQRLTIARALLKHPKILILDNATSATDTNTEAKIWQAFRHEMPDVTKLIITQRLGGIVDADKILIMAGGKIAAAGTHSELLAENEWYRQLYDTQTKRGGGQHD